MHHNLFRIQFLSVDLRQILLFILFYFALQIASAKICVITGTAGDFKNTEISIIRYLDYISFEEDELASVTTDQQGRFRLEFEIKGTIQAFVRVQGAEYVLYLEEGAQLNIVLSNPAKNEQGDGLVINNSESDEINKKIRKFNAEYTKLTAQYYSHLVRGRKKSLIDSVFTDLSRRYTSKGRDFVNTYVTCKIALLHQMIYKNKKKFFEDKYIKNQNVRAGHPEYMNFIIQYFPNKLLLVSMSLEGEHVKDDINVRKNYKGLMDALATDPSLSNDTLRELILIKGLFDLYQHPDYKKAMVLDMLDTIIYKTTVPYHKLISANVKSVLTRLSKGSKAPMFSLEDSNGKQVSLSDFYGKYVYLDFWATWCVPCLKEMPLIPSLIEKYGDKIAFVSISMDREFSSMTKFLKEKDYIGDTEKHHGIFLYGGADKKLKKDYNIKSLPTYFFIDPRGQFIESPAARPSQNIEKIFYDIFNPGVKKSGLIDPNE